MDCAAAYVLAKGDEGAISFHEAVDRHKGYEIA
jgi:hypothetical protein